MVHQYQRVAVGYAGIAVAIFAINNPDKAAELVNQVIHAITTFSAHLG